MNILLIAPQFLPIFNREQKGAIEKLEKIYLNYNENTNDCFTVYSPKISRFNFDNPNLSRSVFRNIDQTTLYYKISKLFYSLKKRVKNDLSNECYIRKIAKDIKKRHEENIYDLIIFENGEQGIPIFKKITNTKTKIILHLHNDYLNRTTKNAKKVIAACSEIWGVSDFICNQVKQIGKVKTKTIYNCCEKMAKPDKRIVFETCKKIDIGDSVVFIYVGRLLYCKGIKELLEAFCVYNSKNRNAKLLVAGSTGGGKEAKEIEMLIREYTKKNSQIIKLGHLKAHELSVYRAMSDCQIIPSIWEEAFGLVVLEAMQSNLKIIATKSGGIPEVGKNKIYYVNRKFLVKELASAMSQITKEPLKDNYYDEVLLNFSMEKYCKNIYDSIHCEK